MPVPSYDTISITASATYQLLNSGSNSVSLSQDAAADSITPIISGNSIVGANWTDNGRMFPPIPDNFDIYRTMYQFPNTLKDLGTIELINEGSGHEPFIFWVDSGAAPDDGAGDRDEVIAALHQTPISSINEWNDFSHISEANAVMTAPRGYPYTRTWKFVSSKAQFLLEEEINKGEDYIGIMLLHQQDIDAYNLSTAWDSADTRCYVVPQTVASGQEPEIIIRYRISPVSGAWM